MLLEGFADDPCTGGENSWNAKERRGMAHVSVRHSVDELGLWLRKHGFFVPLGESVLLYRCGPP